MVETRNTTLKRRFTTHLTGLKERVLFDMICRECLLIDVSQSEAFSLCLQRCASKMRRQFGDPMLTSRFIKIHVYFIGQLYNLFKDFALATPGVRYDIIRDKVTVNENYWAHIKKEDNCYRYFRTFGFERYGDCYYLFDIKKAGGILLEDIEQSPQFPRTIASSSSDDSSIDTSFYTTSNSI